MSVCYLKCMTAFVMLRVNLAGIRKMDVALFKTRACKTLCEFPLPFFFLWSKEHLTKVKE